MAEVSFEGSNGRIHFNQRKRQRWRIIPKISPGILPLRRKRNIDFHSNSLAENSTEHSALLGTPLCLKNKNETTTAGTAFLPPVLTQHTEIPVAVALLSPFNSCSPFSTLNNH